MSPPTGDHRVKSRSVMEDSIEADGSMPSAPVRHLLRGECQDGDRHQGSKAVGDRANQRPPPRAAVVRGTEQRMAEAPARPGPPVAIPRGGGAGNAGPAASSFADSHRNVRSASKNGKLRCRMRAGVESCGPRKEDIPARPPLPTEALRPVQRAVDSRPSYRFCDARAPAHLHPASSGCCATPLAAGPALLRDAAAGLVDDPV